LSSEIDPRVPQEVIGDPTRIKQILINLLSNAIKFTSKGEIKIGLRLSGSSHPSSSPFKTTPLSNKRTITFMINNKNKTMAEKKDQKNLQHLEFFVSDTGPGLAKEQLSRLFAPFEQLKPSVTREHGGTGLGLSIVRQLVDCMGGRITVESELGVGTTFTIFLSFPCVSSDDSKKKGIDPKEQNMRKKAPRNSVSSSVNTSQKLCIVDDNETNRKILIRMLSQFQGLDIRSCTNGAEAVELIVREDQLGKPFDFVFMDLMMPVLDGMGATKQLRQKGFKLPIFALSANSLPHEKDECLTAGMTAHLAKPFTKHDILHLLHWSMNLTLTPKPV
jgi:CheY-like chemotaxis protein